MKIGITGCKGRMGLMLVHEILSGAFDGVELAGGTVLAEDMGKTKADFFITADADELFKKSDTVIDFTAPEATRKHIWLAAKHHKSYIIGTTGLTDADEKEMKDAAKETRIVYAANYSVGVNLLAALVEKASETLGAEWDIEIFEAHHKHKIDAPSGTALALGKAAKKGRKKALSPSGRGLGEGDYGSSGNNFELRNSLPPSPRPSPQGERETESPFVFARHGENSKRKAGDIGFSVARGGDVVGDHRVYFYGEGERIELSHVATNRALFARGAIRAALWTQEKKDGLYTMRDVLGL